MSDEEYQEYGACIYIWPHKDGYVIRQGPEHSPSKFQYCQLVELSAVGGDLTDLPRRVTFQWVAWGTQDKSVKWGAWMATSLSVEDINPLEVRRFRLNT